MKTYTINAFGMTLTAAERGGQITSWQDANGYEHIWTGRPDVWKEQTPTLFPVCGATRDLTIDGKSFALPKHGFVKAAMWQLDQQTEDALVFSITDDETAIPCILTPSNSPKPFACFRAAFHAPTR